MRKSELELTVPFINSGEATFGKVNFAEESYTVTAKVVTADSVLKNKNPCLIKIDVEGFECHVIRGLKETLTKHHPVVLTEIVHQYLKASGSSVSMLTQQMNTLGYRGFKLRLQKKSGTHVWAVSPMNDTDNNFDAVWVHDKSPRRHLMA